MKILHLVSYALYSGPMAQVLGLALAQKAQGHQVWLAYDEKRDGFSPHEEAAGPWVKPHGLSPMRHLTLSAKSSPAEFLRDLKNLKGLVKDEAIDVVHTHLSHDHMVAALAGIHKRTTLVRTLHAERSLQKRLGQGWMLKKAHGFVLRAQDHEARLTKNFAVPKERSAVIQGSVDSDYFVAATAEDRKAARDRLKLPQNAKIIIHTALMVGRGHEELASALAQLQDAQSRHAKNIHLLFVGRGADEAKVHAHVNALGLQAHCHFPGYLSGKDLIMAYHAADAAFSAQAGNDASVRAVLEAMACELPVLGVKDGAIAEVVTQDCGYPIPSRDPVVIAEALKQWSADLEAGKAQPKGHAAMEMMRKQRSFKVQAQQTQAFYEKIRSIS